MTHNVEKDGEKYIAVDDKVGNVQKKVLWFWQQIVEYCGSVVITEVFIGTPVHFIWVPGS